MAAHDPYRRHSSATSSSSSNPRDIPPAPPLPPDHAHRPAPGFLDRFLYGPRRATNTLIASTHRDSIPQQPSRELKARLLFTQNFGHAGSQSASHRTGLKLRALDINESRTHVVLAGVKILKTVRVTQASCIEDVNIRSAAVNYVWNDDRARASHSQQDLASAQRETFDIEDVAWSNQQFSSNIATAASNGKIMLYDLSRPGVEVGRLYEHHRQVHKVDFNPHEGQFLLSGSQDGTVRLWDLRSPRRVIECKSKDTFPGRSDGIRHTKWSPTSKWSFALGTDNGTIQRWDVRQNKAPVLKLLAHTKTCTSIDWHPDGRHMISASKDQDVKVWDLQADRRQKPAFEVRCPKPVQNVRWRPPCYVADGSDQWTKQCTHFATSYRHYPLVHVWDLRRPFMPYREFHHNVNSGTTDLMWHSQDLLWTVGPEGEFTQSDVRYMPRVLDHRPMQTFAEAPGGDFSFFSQPRPKTLSSADSDAYAQPEGPSEQRPIRLRHSGSPNLVSSSLAKSDDYQDEKFLSSSLPKHQSRSSSFRSAGSKGATPPSYEDLVKPVNQLDQTMNDQPLQESAQVSEMGSNPCSISADAFELLCKRLNLSRGSDVFLKSAANLDEHLQSLEDDYEATEDYESTQTIAFLRLELGRVVDLAKDGQSFDINQLSRVNIDESHDHGDALRPFRPVNKMIANVRESGTVYEDGSNVTTPLARPLKALPDAAGRPETPTIDLGEGRLQDSPEFARIPQIETGFSEQTPQSSAIRDMHSEGPSISGQQSESDENLPLDLSVDRRGSEDSLQIFPTSWGADEKPVLDSAASSWTKNAAENFNRHPSFRSQTWRSETDTTKSSAESGSVAASESASSSSRPVDGILRPSSVLQEAMTRFDIPEVAASSAESDTVAARDMQVKPAVRLDALKGLGSPSTASHEESKTLMEESMSSLPAITNYSQALQEAPQQVHKLLETLQELLHFHSAQNEEVIASQLFLSMAPILPYLTASILARGNAAYIPNPSFHEALSSTLDISPVQATEILKACHAPLEAAGISPFHMESLLSAVHARLFALELHQEATLLRRISYPAFPGVYELGLRDVDVGTLCTACRSPIANSSDPHTCESCGAKQAPCAVCFSASSPFDLASQPDDALDTTARSLFPLYALSQPPARSHAETATYTACALCAHISHAGCARAWFVDDAGDACPVPGCGCDCVPGPYRDARMVMEAQLKHVERGRGSGNVKRDSWEVGQSEAVGRVGAALRKG